MKKTFVILTIVLAILAAPVFAEVTASGEVDFEWAFNADDYAEQIDSNDMTIDLGGTVGEYTSIKAEFEGEFADTDGTIGDDLDGDDATDDAVYLNQATITQDITGALGIESPVSVALTFGVDSVGDDPENYNEVAGYSFESDGELDPETIMTKVSFGIDTFTVDLSIWEDQKFAAEAYGNVADMADVSVYYYKDGASGKIEDLADKIKAAQALSSMEINNGDDTYVIGFNGAATVMEGLQIGAGVEFVSFDKATYSTDGGTTFDDLSDDTDISNISAFGVSAAYTTGPLSAGLSLRTLYFEDGDALEYKFTEQTEAAVNVSYAATEMLTPFAAIKSVLDAGDDDFSDVVCYEVGVEAAIDSVTYTTGYTLGSDWKAYDPGFMDGSDRAGSFFVKVGAEF